MSPSDEAALREADQFIEELRRSIHHGFGDVSTAKELLRTVLRRRMWTDRIVNMTDHRQTYAEFIRFVTEPPPGGLATTIDTLDTLAHSDTELEDLLTEATKRPKGRPSNGDKSVQCTDLSEYPAGNTRAAGLRRLRKDRLDLHDRVIAGKMTVNAAMIVAGFRPKTRSVALDPESIAALVIRNFDTEQIAELIERLVPYLPIEKAQ